MSRGSRLMYLLQLESSSSSRICSISTSISGRAVSLRQSSTVALPSNVGSFWCHYLIGCLLSPGQAKTGHTYQHTHRPGPSPTHDGGPPAAPEARHVGNQAVILAALRGSHSPGPHR